MSAPIVTQTTPMFQRSQINCHIDFALLCKGLGGVRVPCGTFTKNGFETSVSCRPLAYHALRSISCTDQVAATSFFAYPRRWQYVGHSMALASSSQLSPRDVVLLAGKHRVVVFDANYSQTPDIRNVAPAQKVNVVNLLESRTRC